MSTIDTETDELLTHHSHDQHFLGRLERVGCREADLALRLYHEPNLVRCLLGDAALVGAGERIAVSLDASAAPPYAVLTREGKFVTCLGAGMHPGTLPVLGWQRVCYQVERFDREHQRLNQALSALQESSDAIGRQLAYGGARLSRESLQQALIVEPLLHHKMLLRVVDYSRALLDDLAGIARIKRPQARLPYLRAYWKMLHALGHLLVLTSNLGRRGFGYVETMLDRGVDYFDAILLPLLDIGYGPLGLRVLWSVSRAGKLALPTLKQSIQQQNTLRGWIMMATALATVGIRHQRLRAEVIGVLNASTVPDATEFARVLHSLLKHPGLNGSTDEESRRTVAQALARMAIAVPAGTPHAPDVPVPAGEPLDLPRLANAPLNYQANSINLWSLMFGAVALATQPAEALYFPAEHLGLAPGFSPELLSRLGDWKPSKPVSAPPKPGRNDPCSCGSGKKYKKCCG